jgi:AcrR family transcriptional regulator
VAVAEGSPSGRRPGRPRSVAREHAILRSAGRLLLDTGMAGFTIERVAADAGVSRVTIYKWWPSKGALALDAFLHAVQDEIAYPDTGDLRADLTAQVASLVRLFRDTPAGKVLAGLLAAAQQDPAMGQEFRDRWLQPRRALAEAMLRGGQQRGMVRDDADLAVVIDEIYGPVYYRLMTGHEPLVDDLAATIVDNVLDGVISRA